MQKRSSWIGTVPSKQLHVKDRLGVEVYCSVQPRPLAVDFDSGLVTRDPRRLRRRQFANAISDSVNPLANRLM
jgi:hypothetical protein